MTSLTLSSGVSAWRLDWPMAIIVLALVVGYVWGVRRVRGAWPVTRMIWFGLGVLITVLVTMWWPGAYAHQLMWVFTLQVTTLLTVAAPLVCLGRPLTLAGEALPEHAAGRLRSILDTRPARLLTSPIITPLLLPIALSAVFFTPLLTAALRSDPVLLATQVGLFACGLLFALPLAGDDRERTVLALTAGIFIGFLELFLDAVPGIVIRLTAHPLVTTVASLRHPSWGPSLLSDQQSAGSILWFLSEVMDLPFLALLFVQWSRRDRAEAASIDRALDEQHLRTPVTVDEDTGLSAPWWLQDPDRFDARRAAEFRNQHRE